MDKEGKEIMKITNEVWLLKQKICLTAVAIVIIIHRDKAQIDMEMDMEEMVKIVQKINSKEFERSSAIREKLGHITNTVRVMKEVKETKISIKYQERIKEEKESITYRTEIRLQECEYKSYFPAFEYEIIE
ncbi:25622_t:CDS:1, partial [Gigaspora rosea]